MSKLGVDIARAAVKVVGRLPLKVHYVFADFIAWLAGQTAVYAWEMPGKRYDIGNLESYEEVKRVYKGV